MIIESRAKLLCCCCIFIISVSDSVMLNAEVCLYVPRFLLLYDSVVGLKSCVLYCSFSSLLLLNLSQSFTLQSRVPRVQLSAFFSSLLVCFIIDNSV